MFIVAALTVLAGMLVAVGGVLGWRGSLHRRHGAGVRTAATLRSEEAFAVGNRVAGIPTIAAGGVAVVAGVAALAVPTTAASVVTVALGIAGLLALLAAGGVLGHQAAATVDVEPAADCGTCNCASCPLVTAGD